MPSALKPFYGTQRTLSVQLFPSSGGRPQEQAIFDGYEFVGGANQRCGGELGDTIDLEFDSRVRIYRLRNEPMTALKAWLEATETMWTRQLVALNTHLKKPTQ